MKQVSQNYKSGEIRLEEVQPPALRAGGVLVRSAFSLISAGTEMMKVREGRLSYLGKARARPDQLKKVLNSVRQQGLLATYEKVMNKLDSLTPLGYSTAGIVIAVGRGAEEFHVGQRVACGGAGYANHAETNFVPKNLVVPVPDGVPLKHAAFTTVGAIAMQGYRQGNLQIGETACVIGLGLLGQLLVQILRAGGVAAIGVDLAQDRCDLATSLGAKAAFLPDDPGLHNTVLRLSGGKGADCVFIAASGDTNRPAELAVELARDRARVVDIGKTRLELPWNDYYMKELDIRFSRSYGPGRYDPVYEERGIDYPVGYVRWTENRNMASFLDLVAEGRVSLEPLISSVEPFERAEQTYRRLAEGTGAGLATVFEYSNVVPDYATRFESPKVVPVARPETLRIGAVGAGNYASSMLFPHLRKMKNIELTAVATTSSLSAQNAVRKFGFQRATTAYEELIKASDVDAVIITTRHSSHARMTAEALAAGKVTYVEKPLALSLEEVASVQQVISESGNARLMVGFNRRFSKAVRDVAGYFSSVGGPLVIHYRVHAGQLDSGSWYLDPAEGSRFVGEAGHFLDVFSLLTRSRPVSVFAKSLKPSRVIADDLENIAAVIEYENGCVANLLYLTQGSPKVGKEFMEIFGGGKTARLLNFESTEFYDGSGLERKKYFRIDKGQRQELEAFVAAIKSGGEMPISLTEVLDTTVATLAIEESLRTGKAIRIEEFRNALDPGQ